MAVNNLLVIPWGLRFLDITFCVFFTLELALRIFAHRRRFFRMNGCAWNVMDLLLVSAHAAWLSPQHDHLCAMKGWIMDRLLMIYI